MSQTQSLENHGLEYTVFRPSLEQTYSKKSDLEIILHRLYHRENAVFNRIVIAIKTNENAQSMMLASELIRIRILKRNFCLALELMYHYNIRHSY